MLFKKVITLLTLLGLLSAPVYADPYECNSTIPDIQGVTVFNLQPFYFELLIMPRIAPLNEQVVEVAKQYLGVPYVWGGTTPKGFDCSGLVQYCYRQVGIEITRTTYTQILDGQAVDKNDLQVGDLVFFGTSKRPHHVGMYIGEGQFIHAPHTGDVVKISFLADRSDYSAARRIVIYE